MVGLRKSEPLKLGEEEQAKLSVEAKEAMSVFSVFGFPTFSITYYPYRQRAIFKGFCWFFWSKGERHRKESSSK